MSKDSKDSKEINIHAPENLPSESDVLTKYKTAGDIAQRTLKAVTEACKPDASIFDICQLGDKMIIDETSKLFKKAKEGEKIEKGIAFPTCISVNNCVCHFSPLASDPVVKLKEGDLVKVELGVHIDFFPAQIGHTFVVGATKANPAVEKKADVIKAAHLIGEATMRMIKTGQNTTAFAPVAEKIAASFGCKLVEGFSCHQVFKNTLDGEKNIVFCPSESQRKEVKNFVIGDNEIYTIDVLVTSGEGKSKAMDTRTTVFKKTATTYLLKMKSSRAVFGEITSKFGGMGFNLRSFEDERKARMGVIECVNHNLLVPYDVLYEKEDKVVALYKFSVLNTPNGLIILSAPTFDEDLVNTSHKVEDEELKTLLAAPLKKKSAPKKKKSGEKKEGEGEAEKKEGEPSTSQ